MAKHYKEKNAYRFYEPNGGATEFINNFATSDKIIHMFLGGNGASKSCSLANIVANLCWPGKNPWFKGGLFDEWPYDKTIRIVSDPTTISEKTIPEFEKWFPQGRYKAFKDKKNFFSKWETDTGWKLDCMTYEQDPKEFESVERGLILFDEPPPEAILKASISRLRLGGRIGIFMTPLASAAYLFDQYVDNTEQQLATWVEVDIEANCREHGIRGFLKHQDIENIIANYDEEEQQARVHGKFMFLVGIIYKMFNRGTHIIAPFEEAVLKWPKNTWKVVWAIDQHPVVQTAVMFMAILQDGRKVVIDEIWTHAQLKDLAGEILTKLDRFKELGGQIDPVGLIDASSVIEDQLRGGISVKTDLENYLKPSKLIIEEAPKDRDRGEDLVKQELRGTINPNLYVTANCKQTIWEFSRYSVNPKYPTKRIDKNDHFMENLYRLVLVNTHILFDRTRDEVRTGARKKMVGLGMNNRR